MPFVSRLIRGLALAILAAYATSGNAHAAEGEAFTLLSEKSKVIEAQRHSTGMAYVISGAVAIGVSIPAYFLSDDIFAKTLYVTGQGLGAIAVGYGVTQLSVDDDYTRFLKMLQSAPSLSSDEKERLSRHMINSGAEKANQSRKIRSITFSLATVLYAVNALGAKNEELKTALFFVSGASAAGALTNLLGSSEEEQLAQRLKSRDQTRLKWKIGPSVSTRETGGGLAVNLTF